MEVDRRVLDIKIFIEQFRLQGSAPGNFPVFLAVNDICSVCSGTYTMRVRVVVPTPAPGINNGWLNICVEVEY